MKFKNRKIFHSIFTSYKFSLNVLRTIWSFVILTGSFKFPFCCGADAARILQGDTRRQRHWTVLEEINLQGHIPNGRSCTRVLQIPELLGATRVNETIRRNIFNSLFPSFLPVFFSFRIWVFVCWLQLSPQYCACSLHIYIYIIYSNAYIIQYFPQFPVFLLDHNVLQLTVRCFPCSC